MLVDIKEAAKALGVSVHELRTGAIKGKYPFLLCGTKRMFDVSEVAMVMREQMYANQEEARKCLTN